MDRIVSPDSYIEALTLKVTIFGDSYVRKQSRLNEIIKVWSWSGTISVLIGRDARELPFSLSAMRRHSEKAAFCKSRRQTLPGGETAGTLILDF